MLKDTRQRCARYPLLRLAVAFIAGIVFARNFELRAMPIFAAGAFAAAVFGALQRHRLAAPALVLAFFALGATSYKIETAAGDNESRIRTIYGNGQITSGESVTIDGVIRSAIEPTSDGWILRVAVEQITFRERSTTASGDVKIFVAAGVNREYFAGLSLTTGSRIRVACELEREERFANPGVRSRIASLDEAGIDATATLKSPLSIEKTGQVRNSLNSIYAIRDSLLTKFREDFEPRTAGVLAASLLGDKYFLDKETADVFRAGGTFHILVISGLHITFIGGLVLFATSRLTRRKSVQFLAASTFLWLYTLAVGAEIPVARASLVFTILIFSRVIYRQASLLNSLAAAALILLALRPSSVFTISFQLTFVSVGSIVAIAFPLIESFRKAGQWMPLASEPLPPAMPLTLNRLCETIYWRPKAWEIEQTRQSWSASLFKRPFLRFGGGVFQKAIAYVFEGLVVSTIVQIFLLPLLIYYFHRVATAGILLNIWVGFVMAVESFAAVAAVAVGYFSEVAALPLVWIAETLNAALLASSTFAVDSGLTSIRLPVYSGFGSIFYFAYFLPLIALAAFLTEMSAWRVRAGSLPPKPIFTASFALLIVFGSAIAWHPFSTRAADGRLRVEFLDVGQGDASLITFPDGQTMLIDAGGRQLFGAATGETGNASFQADIPSIGESVVSEFLWEKGYAKIDYIVASHADADHIGGLVDVASNFRIGAAFIGRVPTENANFDRFTAALERQGATFTMLSTTENIKIGGALVETLNPPKGGTSNNDNSVVLRINYGERSFLFTGDVERGGEVRLGQASVAADVVKVAHHGSRTSSIEPFVNNVGAAFAVISVGRRSSFGHPHAEVVSRWKSAGAVVLTTGENGTISFSTDGKDLSAQTFLEPIAR